MAPIHEKLSLGASKISPYENAYVSSSSHARRRDERSIRAPGVSDDDYCSSSGLAAARERVTPSPDGISTRRAEIKAMRNVALYARWKLLVNHIADAGVAIKPCMSPADVSSCCRKAARITSISLLLRNDLVAYRKSVIVLASIKNRRTYVHQQAVKISVKRVRWHLWA